MSKSVMLINKVPRKPSATRVHVWRKLKQLGVVAAQDAAWILPATPRTEEQFRWLAAEITELRGDAMFWKSELAYASDEPTLIRQFTEPLEADYPEILKAAKRKDAHLAEARDYFHSELGRDLRQALVSLKTPG